MKNQRWYDKYTEFNDILEALRGFKPEDIEILLEDVIQTSMAIKKTRLDTELVSLGIDKIKSIMQSENKRRWYDKDKTLYTFINTITALTEEDFQNVISALHSTLINNEQ